MAARTRLAKGTERRQRIVRAAAALITEEGPAAVSHRSVATRAGVPLAATTYYFSGLADLLAEAGALVVAAWALHVERVAEAAVAAVRDDREALLTAVLDAVLPRETAQVAPHYQHLVAAAEVPALAEAYAAGRARIDAALATLLTTGGSTASPALVVAVVDGAAVSALTEGRPVRPLARDLLDHVL